jgi:thiamine-monophosphate kinase
MLEDKHDELTPLSKVGEFGLIDRIKKQVELKQKSTIKGIGDDAAVLSFEGKEMAVSTDILTEGVHFDLSYTPLKHLGYKAVVVNLSDIYAMNATPTQITVSIAVSSRFTLEAIDELYSGIFLACEKYGVDLVGGDTCSSKSGMTISITAIGYAEKGEIVYRNGARPNDLICVSGDLGAAFLGLQILEREKNVYLEAPGTQPDLEGYDYILERQLKPEARKDIIELFKEKGIKPTSMIDISDGLASEILHLANASDCGMKIFENKIPLDGLTMTTSEEFNISPITAAMNGGEDYELLFTLPIYDYEKIKNEALVSVIGHVMATPQRLLIPSSGEEIEIKAQGWSAFKN